MSTEPGSVTTRCVYYFGGFDPRGAGHYHKLFRNQAEKLQDENTRIKIGKRCRASDVFYFWSVFLEKHSAESLNNEQIQTTHVFMGWDDIIRRYWARSNVELIYYFLASYLSKTSWSALNRVRKYFFPAFFSGIFPFVFFIFYAITAFVSVYLTDKIIQHVANFESLIALAIRISVFILLTALFYILANRIGVLWLLRIYHFNILFSEEKIEGIESRQKEWVEHIIERQIKDPVDEVIFSAHSVGTLLLIGVIDRLLADERWKKLQCKTTINILTLGQCYPFITLMPSAVNFRLALQRICNDKNVMWLDVTARIDPLCFFNMHPLQHTGIDFTHFPQPLLHSARFFRMYNPEKWREIRRNKMLAHFLYLMAPDKAHGFNVYDFFYGPDTFRNKVVQLSHARKSA